jgi:hypothetical protein
MKRHPVINIVRLVSIFLVLSSLTCCSYKLVSDEGISPSPKSSREAELIALCLWEGLFPPDDFVERVQSDLAAIRSAYGGEIQAINRITFVPPWVPGELLVGFDDATLKEVANGTYHGNDNAWDKLNKQFEAEIDTSSLKLGGRSIKLHFKEKLHPCRLIEDFYRQAFLPGIKYIQPNYRYGDSPQIYARKTGDKISYLFRNAWGDCPAGCIESEYWYFIADDGVKPVYMGYFAPRKASPEPEWWNEAKQNIELYRGWASCKMGAL